MAMKKKDKPLRPDPSRIGADVRGSLSTKKTIMVRPKGRLSKSVVRNPSAPTAAGPRGSGVRVMTPSETGMKTGRAGRNRSGVSISKTYNPSRANQKLIESTQAIARKGYIGLTPADKKAINPKNNKSKGVTPPKKTPPTPPKRRPGLRGFGGGGMFGTKNR